jgi:hypothetical protein
MAVLTRRFFRTEGGRDTQTVTIVPAALACYPRLT